MKTYKICLKICVSSLAMHIFFISKNLSFVLGFTRDQTGVLFDSPNKYCERRQNALVVLWSDCCATTLCYCTFSLVLKMCVICTAYPRLYWRFAWLVLHVLPCAENVPDSSLVLKMCLIRPLYWKCAWFVLYILACTEDVPDWCSTSSLLLKMCLIGTAHPRLYWRCAWLVLHVLACTEDVPDWYCTSSLVLKMCVIGTAHPRLYWRCAWLVLHILACTEDVHDWDCTSSLVLKMCLIHTACPRLYCT